ncbi:MAG: outer membrane protein assembly factor BamA [Proteobacteria bacterium]|nr:outer membrane protein assembly factor BamA [Pseudomonadota bacterium]
MNRLLFFRHSLAALTFLLISPTANIDAGEFQSEGKIITSIEVKGQRRIEKGAILSHAKSRVGGYFSRKTVSEDIKSIFQMGYFEDVKADLSEGDLGPKLTFIVKERILIRSVRVEGTVELKKETVMAVITVRPDTIYSMDKIRESEEEVSELYEEKGFFLADITHRLDYDGDEAALVFDVVEGRKIKIKKINILGNQKFSDEDLLDVPGVETKEGGFFSWLTGSGKFDEETLYKDIDLIRAFYYNNGYIQAKIEDPQVFMAPDKKALYVTLRVFEGEQFSVGKISFSGDLSRSPEEETATRSDLRLKEGDIFNGQKMRGDIVILKDTFADRGYAFADVSPKTDVEEDRRLVNITYDADKGSLVYINRINIAGNTHTRDKVVRRELNVRETELYNGSAIRRSRQKVNNLGFFKQVDFKTERISKDKIDINIQVEEGPTGTFTVGAGYSSNDGLVGMISLSQGNLFGTGRKIKFSTEFGGESSNYSISYTEPYVFDSKFTAGFDLFNSNREYDDYESSRSGFSLRGGRSLGEYSRLNLKYSFESLEIDNVSATASPYIQDSEGKTTTSSITTTLRRDSRDNYLNPSRGSDNSISLEYAGGPLRGANNFYKIVGSSAWFFPGWKNHTMMLRGRLGYARSTDENELHIDERFFLGGINSVRGYEHRSIGPEEISAIDGLPYVVGGNKELLFNAEYLFYISEDAGLKGLFFFDAGNVYAASERYGIRSLRKSVGYGVRWYSPVGPLRLEWGHALDPKPGESKSRWEFSIGSFF